MPQRCVAGRNSPLAKDPAQRSCPHRLRANVLSGDSSRQGLQERRIGREIAIGSREQATAAFKTAPTCTVDVIVEKYGRPQVAFPSNCNTCLNSGLIRWDADSRGPRLCVREGQVNRKAQYRSKERARIYS